MMALVAQADGWHVSEHNAAEPGIGRGRGLREAVLLAAADKDSIVIHGTAATRSLARQYAVQLPGVVDVGRGRHLQRVPSAR